MKSWLSESVIVENQKLFPFRQVGAIPFFENEMMQFPQLIVV